MISSRQSLRLYSPTLPLLCSPVPPGSAQVGDSHVISTCQTHDLGIWSLGLRKSHTLYGFRRFRPTMFQSIGLPSRSLQRLITPDRRIPKGLYSHAGLSPAITGLSYPETRAFPRGAEQSRFPLVPLPHYCGLVSPPGKPGLRRSFSNAPQRGFAPLHVEQGLCSLPSLPCPCRPTSKPLWAWIGSKKDCRLLAPFTAAPAPVKRHAAMAVC